jgi:hypothetical protein
LMISSVLSDGIKSETILKKNSIINSGLLKKKDQKTSSNAFWSFKSKF